MKRGSTYWVGFEELGTLVDGTLLLLLEAGAVSVVVVAAGVDLVDDEVVAGLVLLDGIVVVADFVDEVEEVDAGLVFAAVLVVDLVDVVLFDASVFIGVLVLDVAVV